MLRRGAFKYNRSSRKKFYTMVLRVLFVFLLIHSMVAYSINQSSASKCNKFRIIRQTISTDSSLLECALCMEGPRFVKRYSSGPHQFHDLLFPFLVQTSPRISFHHIFCEIEVRRSEAMLDIAHEGIRGRESCIQSSCRVQCILRAIRKNRKPYVASQIQP